ncbi:MAG: hypothetical protein SF051_15855 [Elusimicrobiota bacterium]|nr:hypothetical protein [Elusimicrobiota bacterium]
MGLSDAGATLHAYGKTTNTLYRRSADGALTRVPGPAGYRESIHALPDGKFVVNQGKERLTYYDARTLEPRTLTLAVRVAHDGAKVTELRRAEGGAPLTLTGEARFRGATLRHKGASLTLRWVLEGLERADAAAAEAERVAAEASREALAAAQAEAAALRGRVEGLEAEVGALKGAPAPGEPSAVPAASPAGRRAGGGLLPGAGLVSRAMNTWAAWTGQARSLGRRPASPSEVERYADLREQRRLILAQIEATRAEGSNQAAAGGVWRTVRHLVNGTFTGLVALSFVAADVVIFSGFWSGIFGGPFGVPMSLMPMLIGSSLWGLVAVGIMRAAKGRNRAVKAVAVATLAALFIVGVMVGLSHLGVAESAAAAAAPGGDALAGFLSETAAAPAAASAGAAAPAGGVFGAIGAFIARFPVLGPLVFGVFAVASSIAAGNWLFRAAGYFARATGDRRLSEEDWERLDSLDRDRMAPVLRRMRALERRTDAAEQLAARDAAAAADAASRPVNP